MERQTEEDGGSSEARENLWNGRPRRTEVQSGEGESVERQTKLDGGPVR